MKKAYYIIIVALCVAILGGFTLSVKNAPNNSKETVKNENVAVLDTMENKEEIEVEQPEIEKDKTTLACEKIESDILKEYGDFEIYSTSELSLEILENRMEQSNKVIVEKTIGEVLDDDLNGCAEDFYICYRSVPGVKVGDRVISYFVYNPVSNYCDDIIERYDVIVE